MAALSGVMTADFTQFTTEIDKSIVKLQQFERAGEQTEGAMGGMADGLAIADKTLGAMGIRISPAIQSLRELGNAANITYDKLGLLGSAGALGASFTVGWQIGTAIADFYGLHEAIGNATASLLGWGDVVAARAGAQTEALARATKAAGREITDINEAIRINLQTNREMSNALNNGAERWRQWTTEIAKLRDSGALPEIDKQLKNKTSTMKQLAAEYGISEAALTYYINRTKESSAILADWHAKEDARLEKTRVAQQELAQASGGWRDTLLTIAPATAAAAMAALNYGLAQEQVAAATGLSVLQVSALDRALQHQTATLAVTEPALGTLDQFMRGLAPEIRKAGESTAFFDQQLMASIATVESAAVPALEKLEETYRSVTEAAREAAAPSKNAPGSVGVNLGGMAFGTMGVEAAMAAYTARFGSGSAAGAIGGGPAPDFLSWAMKMGYATKGTQVSNTFNIVDTESEIARRVSEEISRQIQRGSLVT
jgi:transcriptional regulator with XRE-family HTH domain